MAEKLGKWASNRGLISKIRPSDGCKEDTVPSTVVRGYDLCKPGGHLGNVGYIGRRFKNDTERLGKLFDLYTKMTASEKPGRK